MYADDTSVFTSADNMDALEKLMNEDLVRLQSWCEESKLVINQKKTNTNVPC